MSEEAIICIRLIFEIVVFRNQNGFDEKSVAHDIPYYF